MAEAGKETSVTNTMLQISGKSEGPIQEGVQIHVPGRGVDFDSIYHSYRRRVYALCLRMVHNQADAEDLTLEAFFQVFRKICTFRGDSAFTTWLHRLVVNVVLVRLRKKSPMECSMDSDNRFEGETSPSQESFGHLDTALISAVDRLSLELAVAELPLGSRTIFVLHDVEGYEHNEIARLLGVSEGTSKSQLHRARCRLRDLLKRSRVRKPHAGIAPSHRTGSAGAGSGRSWAREGARHHSHRSAGTAGAGQDGTAEAGRSGRASRGPDGLRTQGA
jgi:RNA polymerase sigma-70 factor, ECF subfamily